MVDEKGDYDGEEEGDAKRKEGKRKAMLREKAGKLKCPVCDAPANLRFKDGALVCRSGGHITFPDGCVTLPGGVETTLKELRDKRIIKEG